MKRFFKISVIVIVSLCLLLSLSGCAQSKKPEVINISYSTRPLNVPAVVAIEKKMFEEEFAKDGIKIKWYELEGPATTEALAAKSIDFATSLNYVSAIISAANGNDIKVIASYSKFPKGIGLVASTASGVSSVADLKGKKVALQKGTMLHEMLLKALEEAKIPVSDVEIVGMASPDAINAVMQNQVDAAVLPDPLMTKAIATKKVKLLRTAEGLILGQSVIASRSEFVFAHTVEVTKFLEIQQKVLDWSNNHKDESLSLVSKVNQMDIKAVNALYPKFDFTMAIDSENLQGFKDSADFLKANGFIKSNTNTNSLIKKLVYTGFLEK